jgi:hypothetical protein
MADCARSMIVILRQLRRAKVTLVADHHDSSSDRAAVLEDCHAIVSMKATCSSTEYVPAERWLQEEAARALASGMCSFESCCVHSA